MSFLKAEWRKLIVVNYVVDPEFLKEYIPKGTELDLFEGKCFVSLVGFMFINTKVLGIKIPAHINFEEVNLRFYVKRIVNNETRRGVVFIKEIVPKRAITFIANTLYKEHYQTLSMTHNWTDNASSIGVSYQWKKNKSWQFVKVIAQNELVDIAEGSEVEFITEHYWGYSKVTTNKTNEYEVTHPKWKHYPIKQFSMDIDFSLTYGKEFEFMNQLNVHSIYLAEGSEITVENKTTLG